MTNAERTCCQSATRTKTWVPGQHSDFSLFSNLIEVWNAFNLFSGFRFATCSWDAVFGLISNHLLSAGDRLQTSQDFRRQDLKNKTTLPPIYWGSFTHTCRLLESKVAPVFADRGEFFKVILMDRVIWLAEKANTFFPNFRHVCHSRFDHQVRCVRGKTLSPRSWALTRHIVLAKMKKTRCHIPSSSGAGRVTWQVFGVSGCVCHDCAAIFLTAHCQET